MKVDSVGNKLTRLQGRGLNSRCRGDDLHDEGFVNTSVSAL